MTYQVDSIVNKKRHGPRFLQHFQDVSSTYNERRRPNLHSSVLYSSCVFTIISKILLNINSVRHRTTFFCDWSVAVSVFVRLHFACFTSLRSPHCFRFAKRKQNYRFGHTVLTFGNLLAHLRLEIFFGYYVTVCVSRTRPIFREQYGQFSEFVDIIRF